MTHANCESERCKYVKWNNIMNQIELQPKVRRNVNTKNQTVLNGSSSELIAQYIWKE